MSGSRVNAHVRIPNLIVLKLGGSVLESEASLPLAVHEIYRWVRAGHPVIAVVSAFAGRTNALLAQAKQYADEPNQTALAALAATGEETSAALLTMCLERAGIAATCADAAAIGLRTKGETLDAEPVSVDAGAVQARLRDAAVLVVPGFTGRDEHGDTTLLGRGGSDLTALFLAQALGGRCRLVKDVRGVYESDPALGGSPGRFAELTWDEVIRVGSEIVQPKTARLGKQWKCEFEVAGSLSPVVTVVGARQKEPVRDASLPARLKVAVLGCGTVGGGVYQALTRLRNVCEVLSVGVRRREQAIAAGVSEGIITSDLDAVVSGEADVVIELMGGQDPAARLMECALRNGKHVITANKAVIALHGARFQHIARENGVTLRYSAAVGGAVPMIEAVRQVAANGGVARCEGIVNGTTNFVLTLLSEGKSFDEAVRAAQEAGFAEADPSRDLDGVDAEDKLRVLAQIAFGERGKSVQVRRVGLRPQNLNDVAAVRAGRVRHLARLEVDGERLQASVEPVTLDAGHPLLAVRGAGNALAVTCRDGSVMVVRGKGAGRWPTTEAVIADVVDVWLERCGGAQ
ncbi:MAG: homoserine dehydrogenase [Planctomycetes bacterium]|nr:homoserine dehydrogenase [Planctomycetota bacterium]